MKRRVWKQALEHGQDVHRDISSLLPSYKCKTIFDVGAFKGSFTEICLFNYYDPSIYCFEPVKANYDILVSKYKNNNNVKVESCGLDDKDGIKTIYISEDLSMCSLYSKHHTQHETSYLTTLNSYCGSREIKQIDFLKIDTEGNDLNVLRGGDKLLLNHQINFIQVEASMNHANCSHVHINVFNEYMHGYGYYLFGVYNQCLEWQLQKQYMRRADLIYISKKMI